jgi:hypothetical protein
MNKEVKALKNSPAHQFESKQGANNMLTKFIIDGVIGPLRIGLPTSELLALVGPPPTWEGKPGTLLGHRGITNYDKSDTWIYNGVHVDIKEGEIERLALWMDYHPMNWEHEWFGKWPLSSQPSLAEAKDYLDSQQISYAVSGAESPRGYDIIIYKAYVLGTAKLDGEAGGPCVRGIVRVKDSNDLPMGCDDSILNGLGPKD